MEHRGCRNEEDGEDGNDATRSVPNALAFVRLWDSFVKVTSEEPESAERHDNAPVRPRLKLGKSAGPMSRAMC